MGYIHFNIKAPDALASGALYFWERGNSCHIHLCTETSPFTKTEALTSKSAFRRDEPIPMVNPLAAVTSPCQ